MIVELSQDQIVTLLELLKPYAELSVSLTNQYKAQASGAAGLPHAKKIDEQEKK